MLARQCLTGQPIPAKGDTRDELPIGHDNSPPILDLARQRYAGQPRVTITEHEFDDALNGLRWPRTSPHGHWLWWHAG